MMNPAMIRKPAAGIMPYLYTASGGALVSKEGPVLAADFTELEKDERRFVPLHGYNTDGSLPSSQSELDEDEDMDLQSDSRGSTSPPLTPTSDYGPDLLLVETRRLLHHMYRDGNMKMEGSSPKTLATLRRLAAEINDKHKMAFQGMLQKLSIEHPEDIQKLSEVPSMVFSDGVTNWGRIVTLISFGAFVAKHFKSIDMENCIDILADNVTEYLMTHKRTWIVEHNGWEGCVEFFHVEDYESGLRTVLMAFAGVAGIGASLVYMIR